MAITGTPTDFSVTGLTTTSTQLVGINQGRNFLLIQNVSASGDLWINFGSTATAGANSVKLPAGGSLILGEAIGYCPSCAVNARSGSGTVDVTVKEA